jgi:hypothetical protein
MAVAEEARRTQRKPSPIATFPTIYLMWITLDLNPTLRRERSANSCVSHGTAQTHHYLHRDWNKFVSLRPILGYLTPQMKELEPSATPVTTCQSSRRSTPEVLYLTLLFYLQGRFFEQNGPRLSDFSWTSYFLPCVKYKTNILRHLPRQSFYPKILCALLWRTIRLYVSLSFIITQHKNVLSANF